ncbi:hypothetical protein ACNKHO_09175 [Shigella flexneri]
MLSTDRACFTRLRDQRDETFVAILNGELHHLLHLRRQGFGDATSASGEVETPSVWTPDG